MADIYTGTSALTFDQVAWNKVAYKSLRPELYFDNFPMVKGSTFHAGSTVTFPIWTDLTAAITPLSEAVDVDAVALADTTVPVTLVEYGNAVIPTAKVRATSFINIDPDVANLVGFNAGLSIDTLARATYLAGSNVEYAGAATSRVTVASGHTLASEDVRRVVAELRSSNVRTFSGSYAAIIHPYAAVDLRTETGAAAWLDPANYSDAERRWNGEIGKFEGARFVESSRAGRIDDAGVGGTVDVFQTSIFGQEAVAKAWSNGGGYTGGSMPTITIADKADNLNRFRAVGWKFLGGWAVFREAALWRIESSSSLGTNA